MKRIELDKGTTYRQAKLNAADHKDVWLNQAFGAAQYHLIIRPEDEAEVVRHWNERDKPTFERLIYGKSFTL